MTNSRPAGDEFNLPGQFSGPVFAKSTIYQGVPAHHEAEDRLARARALLDSLPLDRVPDAGERVLAAGSRVPHLPNPAFVGRVEALLALAKALKGAGGGAAVYQPSGISGLGGVGKTQLAVEFAHRYGPFFDGGVFWMDCRLPENTSGEIVACGLTGCPDLPADFARLKNQADQVRLIAALWQNPVPRLLILDNCESEELLTYLRPPGGGCRVLVTSRRPEFSRGVGLRPIPLGPLPRPDSIALLREFRQDLAGAEATLDLLAHELGDLPLALHLAGNYLREMEHSPLGRPDRYLADLRRAKPLNHISMQGGDWSPTGHEQHVGRTFQLSYDLLRPEADRDAAARRLLERAACCVPGVPIPRAVLKASLELSEDDAAELRAEAGLRRLEELGLLKREAGGSVTVHRLVATFVLGRVDDLRAAAEAVVRTRSGSAVRGGRNRLTGRGSALGATRALSR